MKYFINNVFYSLLFCIAFACNTNAQKTIEKTRILFIFDASQSMLGNWDSGPKIDIARKFVIEMVDSLRSVDNIEMALRVYGHQSIVPPQDCNDTKLEVPFGPNNSQKIIQKLYSISPKGTTPIANSLRLAANDFPNNNFNTRNVIILITDGVEACDGDPCEVSLELQKKGIFLEPFILGIGNSINLKKSFECVGQFLEVNKEDKFGSTIDFVISQVLDKTSSQINLLDKNGMPTETNVPMSFYDSATKKLKYFYMHTLNGKGNPDTLFLDPLFHYDIEIHTIPKLKKNNVKISSENHNIIGFDAQQGRLKIISPNTNMYRNLKIIVRKGDDTINIQKIAENIKYLKGTYNLEILTYPRIYIKDIKIKANQNIQIDIPRPGLATIFKPTFGFCSLFIEKNKRLEWVLDLDNKKLKETFKLQPGHYQVIYRPKNMNVTQNTRKKNFSISSGKSVPIKL